MVLLKLAEILRCIKFDVHQNTLLDDRIVELVYHKGVGLRLQAFMKSLNLYLTLVRSRNHMVLSKIKWCMPYFLQIPNLNTPPRRDI